MAKKEVSRIQDCVHGLMTFRGSENIVLDILHTPEIQRLRKIRQLGLAHLIYPSSEHSRFIHSLGTSYLAIRFGEQLKTECKNYLIKEVSVGDLEIRDFAVAALCHDLGHGPFSHAWEREIIGEDYNISDWCKSLGISDQANFRDKNIKWHELVTYAFLNWEDGALHNILENHERGLSKRISRFLIGEYHLKYLPKLISSDIDIDRADYILRDSQLSGLKYGQYDLDWLISSCSIGVKDNSEYVIGFNKKKSIRVVEHYLIARRALYETLYFHKTVSCAEGMMGLFLKKLKHSLANEKLNTNSILDSKLHPILDLIKGDPVSQESLLLLHDFSIWTLIEAIANQQSNDDTLMSLANSLLKRELFKMVPCDPDQIKKFLQTHDKSEIYETIEKYCNKGEGRFFLIHDFKQHKALSQNAMEASYFLNDDKVAEPLKDYLLFNNDYFKTLEVNRLFTINEAVHDVKKLIDQKTK
jgi:HD superfamily phosphohydrolase